MFYVYVIFRPDGTPCYVGKGSGQRWRDHKGRNKYNPHLRRIFENALKAGRELPIIKIREGLSEQQTFEIEKALIAAIGRQGIGGPLVNMTDGGDGIKNLSLESRQRMSAIARARPPGYYDGAAKAARARKGIPKSEETRRRMKVKKPPRSPEHCAAISRAAKARRPSDATKDAIRLGMLAAWREGRHPRSRTGGQHPI